MKPAPFDLHRPTSLGEAAEILGAFGDDAKALAGGQSLVPLLALRLATPAHVVDLGLIDELRGIEAAGGNVRIGAMTTHVALETSTVVTSQVPLLARAVPFVGHAAIRSRGTFGGSVAHADPAAEYPAVCVALGATMEIVGPQGSRREQADDFFISTFTTSLAADELLSAVHLPAARGRSGWAIEEVARRHGDFALAGAACAVELDDDGRVARSGIALFGVSDRPWRCERAERALTGSSTELDVDEIAELAVDGLEPTDTLHAPGSYLRRVARVVVARCVRRALMEATNG